MIDLEASKQAAAVPGRTRSQRRPLAYEIRDLIAQEYILTGAVQAGAKLPSEHALSAKYGVSRVTVRAALHGLREMGMISIRQGFGATVLPRLATVVHGLDRLGSIDTFARESGKRVGSIDLEASQTPADEELASRLGVPAGTPVLAISRVKTLDDVRVGWVIDYVPAGILSFETLCSELAGSALDVLLAHPEVGVEYADAEHIPVRLPAGIARRLDVKPGHLALMIDTVVWTGSGRAADWAKVWLLPEYFRFRVRRRLSFME